jgi:hypothetical protein
MAAASAPLLTTSTATFAGYERRRDDGQHHFVIAPRDHERDATNRRIRHTSFSQTRD